MNQVRNIERLNQKELEAGIPIEASWHNEFKDSAYVFFGSLPSELTEGDILIIFSQYGIPVHLKLIRDKETGKSRGFGYLKYEDQRSTILAVDNLNGTKVLGRVIRVNHTFFEERERDEDYEKLLEDELKNDFADIEKEEDLKTETNDQDDEFQDPLLLMQKDKDSDSSKKRSRSRREHGHSHRSRTDSKERSKRHRSRSREHRSSHDKDRSEHRHRSHRHRSSRDKEEKTKEYSNKPEGNEEDSKEQSR